MNRLVDASASAAASVRASRAAFFAAAILVGRAVSAQEPAASPTPVAGAPSTRSVGSISGRVLTPAGAPVPGADVRLVDLRRRVTSDAAGTFRFPDLPPGDYLIQAESRRQGLSVARLTVAAGQETLAEITLDLAVHEEVVVVTARPDASTLGDVAQAISVLSGADLALRLQPTLGETLSHEPGVSSTYFGPGASRPIIRGQGGDRVRILQGGIGTADASNVSPDHAVSFDPLSARQVEIVRGPATLLYGSNAVGGVVNVIDARIPDAVPDKALHGTVALLGGTAAEERSGGLALGGGRGLLAWHADLSGRKTADVRIPGFAESAAVRAAEEAESARAGETAASGPGEVFGRLPNSGVENTAGAVGASLVGASGFLGLSVSGFSSLYGVPGHAHAAEAGEEALVRIDMGQRRLDLRGEWNRAVGPFRGARVRAGLADYEHKELEGDTIGTRFTNQSGEGRLELPHQALGPFTGTFGVQASRRDFQSLGDEAVVPPSITDAVSVFAFEEAGRGAWRFQAGARIDRQSVEARGDAPARRSFTGVSGSMGALWKNARGWSAGVTLARSVKLPTAEELFSDGPHLATRAFERGDRNLERERSLGLDLSLRRKTERLAAELNLFGNRFSGFIYERATGEVEEDLPVFQFVQGDARFWGAEASVAYDVLHAEPHHLDVEVTADYVRAALLERDEPLPRISPARVGAAFHYRGGVVSSRLEVRHTLQQDRTAPMERPTDGYTWLNANIGYRLFAGRAVVDLLLQGNNLTDAEGRPHPSFLKELAPLPGRDVRLNVRLGF